VKKTNIAFVCFLLCTEKFAQQLSLLIKFTLFNSERVPTFHSTHFTLSSSLFKFLYAPLWPPWCRIPDEPFEPFMSRFFQPVNLAVAGLAG
jgi:hypothetical protein